MLRNSIFYTFFLALFFVFTSTKAEYTYSAASPYETVVSHLAFLEANNYYPYIAAQTLGGSEFNTKQKIGLAIKLKQIITKTTIQLPEESQKKRYKNENGDYRYALCPDFPQIYLVRVGKEWRYSQETVAAIPQIYSQLFPSRHHEAATAIHKDTAETTVHKDSAAKVTFSLKSPYHTVRSYYKFTRDDNYFPDIAANVLYAPSYSEHEKVVLIEKYRQVSDALNLDIDFESISRNPDYLNEDNDPKYLFSDKMPEVFLVKEDSSWYFSEATTEFVLKKHDEIYFLGTDRLTDIALLLKKSIGKKTNESVELAENEIPAMLKKWKSISLLLLIVALIVVFLVLSQLTKGITWLLLRNSIYRDKVIPIFSPLYAAAMLKGFLIVFPSLGVKISELEVVFTVLNVFATLLVVVSIFRITDMLTFYFSNRPSAQTDAYKKGLMPFFGMFMKVIVFTISTLLIIQSLGVDLKAFLTGLSIGGLTLALAAQESLKNFFGSVMIFLDRPFQIGDWIVAENMSGDVESIGLRSTRIRTFHNSVVTVPNSKLADFTLDNMGKRHFRRFKTYIRIRYSTPPEKITAYTQRLEQMVLEDEKVYNDKYHIFLNEYGKFGYEILFYVFLNVPTWHEELAVRHALMTKSIKLAQELEIQMADPLNAPFFSEVNE